ncbi:transcription factor HES-4-B-like [Gastrophryne carolinensis]
MAPCNRIEDLDNNMGKEIRKLRKPVIEKMRRDRINSSIEQLRVLLEKEFQKHQLPSKPEKADILEMTVSLLREQLHLATKAVVPCKPTFPASKKEAEILSNNKYLVAQMGFWSEPNKCSSRGEKFCNPFDQGTKSPFDHGTIKQASQVGSPADLWRPW